MLKFRVTFAPTSVILLANMAKKNSDARTRFAQRLRAIRIPRGYKTARSFAEALNIDENRYTRYERAEVEPDLQLLMRMCGLLGATPNDLLCDLIGAPPVDIEMPYGFSERAGSGYQTAAQPQQSQPLAATITDGMAGARSAADWEMATVIAMLEAKTSGLNPDNLPDLERLRRIGPIHAKIDADPFQFLRGLPDRLQAIDVPPDIERRIGNLMQEMIATRRPPSNDNSQ
jgi:transcriptional regulator with XRE-family HTH domain